VKKEKALSQPVQSYDSQKNPKIYVIEMSLQILFSSSIRILFRHREEQKKEKIKEIQVIHKVDCGNVVLRRAFLTITQKITNK